MGGTSGHVSLGFAFLLIGLWHLFNCIKLHSLHPKTYITLPWFPISKLRYTEPILIILVTTIFTSMELSIITSKYLPHIEHSIISTSFFVYAFFGILIDKIRPPAQHGLVHFLQAIAFSQQLLILHLHSTDHMGVEGQYHWLLQLVTFVSLITTLLAIGYPKSFLNSFIRAFSLVFQGVWLIVIGIMLWTPKFIPRGCFLRSGFGRDAILCHGERALERAKALVNIQFGLYLIGLTIFSMSLYLAIFKLYSEEKIEYQSLSKYEEDHIEEGNCGVEGQTKLCLPM
ncbi:hypothetical protein ACJIZ3_016050 [Penstemon smallii]|uniref:Uncharacterized protein n=1 Tax=Penstemon smallii TaxID=265156 RepID=A0ABD3RP90_9LAMI